MLARHVFDELIAPSDVLLDLHGGDMVEALEPFSLYDESPVEEQARELAVAFGLPYVVRSAPAEPRSAGRRRRAAAERRRAGRDRRGRAAAACSRRTRCSCILGGLANALRQLGMLPGDPMPATCGHAQRRPLRLAALRRRRAGGSRTCAWARRCAPARASASVRNLFGDVIERIAAPEDGVVLFVTTSPAVGADGLLLGLGVDIGDVLGCAKTDSGACSTPRAGGSDGVPGPGTIGGSGKRGAAPAWRREAAGAACAADPEREPRRLARAADRRALG